MAEQQHSNQITLCGNVVTRPRFSHRNRDEDFYIFSLEVQRLSGTMDVLHILARTRLLEALSPISGTEKLLVQGEIRSFNNKSGTGAKLVITVFAHELRFTDGADENKVHLQGVLCKTPTLRRTPMGREISDLMLAVNRRYGRSDYIPCIAWGLHARAAAAWSTGTFVSLDGRLQSRAYIKNENGVPVEKTAYEVSLTDIREQSALQTGEIE